MIEAGAFATFLATATVQATPGLDAEDWVLLGTRIVAAAVTLAAGVFGLYSDKAVNRQNGELTPLGRTIALVLVLGVVTQFVGDRIKDDKDKKGTAATTAAIIQNISGAAEQQLKRIADNQDAVDATYLQVGRTYDRVGDTYAAVNTAANNLASTDRRVQETLNKAELLRLQNARILAESDQQQQSATRTLHEVGRSIYPISHDVGVSLLFSVELSDSRLRQYGDRIRRCAMNGKTIGSAGQAQGNLQTCYGFGGHYDRSSGAFPTLDEILAYDALLVTDYAVGIYSGPFDKLSDAEAVLLRDQRRLMHPDARFMVRSDVYSTLHDRTGLIYDADSNRLYFHIGGTIEKTSGEPIPAEVQLSSGRVTSINDLVGSMIVVAASNPYLRKPTVPLKLVRCVLHMSNRRFVIEGRKTTSGDADLGRVWATVTPADPHLFSALIETDRSLFTFGDHANIVLNER